MVLMKFVKPFVDKLEVFRHLLGAIFRDWIMIQWEVVDMHT